MFGKEKDNQTISKPATRNLRISLTEMAMIRKEDIEFWMANRLHGAGAPVKIYRDSKRIEYLGSIHSCLDKEFDQLIFTWSIERRAK